MSNRKVAILGAGPAGLAAAQHLSTNSGITVELFESGRTSAARICPIDRHLHCNGCAGSCNVISGVGGCIQPGDSIKLSMFPSGRQLLEKIGAKNAAQAQEFALKFFSARSKDFLESPTKSFGNLELRQYPIYEVTPEDVLKLHKKFAEIVNGLDQYHPRTTVRKISKSAQGYVVSDEFNNMLSGNFDHIIIATGRAGYDTIMRNSDSINLSSSFPKLSIGLRLELPATMLSSMVEAHRDFKFSKLYGNQKIKSFCFSSSRERGGRIKYCHYPDQFDHPVILLDGHANYENENHGQLVSTTKGNIGLLVQLPKEFSSKWLNNVFLKKYHNLSKGKPIAQSTTGFLNRELDIDPIEVSISDVVGGNTDQFFSTAQHAALKAAILDIAHGIACNSPYTANEVLEAGTCIGPEVEFFWPTISVDENLTSNEAGVFVVGDALGLAQGNLQAAISGFLAADGILQTEAKLDQVHLAAG